ncbi:mediator of DNA damage checkpoint protein 1 isoform X2 [Etheostoma cragini]|uniref:mediator of DNA damage checkpoint protein 1 isoform X2 n=1 Tax=Etheostoma cragini TaxID=417921 RepID=UPI00155EB536|nr:mediator of DNA damage checkpoint protein 1 isoform X2 [Etheostoma cragini]
MDATQMICDSILESDEEENEEENKMKKGRPLAKLCILKNEHIPETELPLFLGDNVLGRDPNNCTLPLPAPSISKQHATICVSVYRRRGYHSKVDVEALVWDLGSMNGTHKGRLKLTPNVRYALSEGERLVVADIPCLYVSCAVDTVPSQGDMRTPVSSNSGVKAPLPDVSGEKGGDTITGSKKCVIGGTTTRVSSPDQKDTRETPVRTNCLSFEQTPTQSQGTLVPESGSDSDGERGDRRRKALVSDSDSYKSIPTCSTFLSPPNKVVPESEDESPITPSSSTKNRPHRHVSFSKEETDLDVGRQQPIKKKAPAVVDDSEEEEEREEERATLRERASGDKKSSPHRNSESGQDVPVKQESNVIITGEDGLPVSTPSIFTDLISAFDMDSDTDMEGEEEGVASLGPVTMNTNQQADQPPDTAQLYMDSDTDVDEDDYVSEKVPKSLPSSADHSNPPQVISVIQPEGITMDSDTDVDDDDAAVSDAGTKVEPTSIQGTHTTDSAPSTQLKDFHLDSDTDVDEEEEKKRETNSTCSKIEETPTKLDIKPLGPDSTPPAPHSLQPDSDTDDEVIPALAISEPSMASAVTESSTSADARAQLCILCDSDTDVEDGAPLVIPVAVPILSVGPGITTEALQSESKADVNPDDLRVDSDTDVEDEKVDIGEAGEGQIPSLPRENTPGFLVPLKQNCSTPIQVSEGEVEDMETQAFLSPSTGPFRRVVTPAIRPMPLSTVSDSQEDDEFVVAETQSFVLQTRDCQANSPEDHTMDPTQAFNLDSSCDEHGEQSSRGGSFEVGSSNSNHLQAQAQALAMDSTQAFVQCVNLEDTQEYAAISNADRTSMENDSNLEATQAYGENEEPVQCSVMSAKEGQLDLDLEATQAYLLEPSIDLEDESDDDERKNTATAETQAFDFPTSSTLAMAGTQPMSAFEEEEEEESLKKENPISSIEVKSSPQNGTDEREEHGEAAQPQKSHLSEALSLAETQPMSISDNEESEDEDFLLGPRIRKANPLQLGEQQTQRLPNSELSAVETQPMGTCDSEQRDEEDSSPVPRKRTARPQQIQEEETQPLTNFESSTVETLEIKTGLQPPRGKGRQSEAGTSGTTIRNTRGTRARLTGAEEQAECSEPPRRRTRGKNKALPTARGRRGKARPDEEENEEEEEVVQAKGAVGKKSMREQKANEDQEERLETERNKHAEKANLIMEQEERREAKLEMERKEKEEKERSQATIAKRLRLEKERAEKDRIDGERKEQEEKKRADKAQKEKEEQLGRERKEKEEKERLEHEKAEREEKERLEHEKAEREEKEILKREKAEREEKERLETEKKKRMEKIKEQGGKESLQTAKREQEERLERERKEQEHQARLEREATEREERESLEEENKPKTPARSRRAARSTAAPHATEPEQDSTVSANDDVPARRTRSRSNSSNSVSSERSASSVNTQGSRGRGRGAKRTGGPPQAAIVRSTNRRSTVAAEATRVTINDVSPQGVRSRSNSTNSEISSCSVSSQGRGNGGRQRGRGRKTEAEPRSIPPFNSQSEPNLAPKLTARGMKAEESSNEVPHEDENEKSDSQQASTTRGRRRANENSSEPAAADKQGPSYQDERCASEESPLPKRNVRGRGQKSETVEALVAPATSDGDEAKDKRRGRKRVLQANKEEDSSSSSKVSKGKEKAQTPEAAEEDANRETNDDIPVRAKRRGRASSAQPKKNPEDSPTEGQVKEESEKMEEETIERRAKGRPSRVQKKKKEEQGESGTSVEQDAEASEPQAPSGSGSRKRQAPVDSSPVAKTPRSSSASPAASGRLRPSSHHYKVLFTGVVDEGGERVLARLGGSMAKGVADMNCLVTDKVRRTVKFLCAVAKGVPIVTTHWLEKSGKAGSFLSPNAFVVKDQEQEKKFNFCLQESLRIASSQSLLQGYDIHVTKSVKPEPVHMKDIISCSGATFLSKMPSSHKPQTVVISCEEDWLLCGPALSASLPVVTAEFILTGILQQKLDLQTHTLSAPGNTLQPAGGRGRGRKKS